eukprot:SAG11_NODE_1101_length_5868_cov_2.045935_2_plen_59_part_00
MRHLSASGFIRQHGGSGVLSWPVSTSLALEQRLSPLEVCRLDDCIISDTELGSILQVY